MCQRNVWRRQIRSNINALTSMFGTIPVSLLDYYEVIIIPRFYVNELKNTPKVNKHKGLC